MWNYKVSCWCHCCNHIVNNIIIILCELNIARSYDWVKYDKWSTKSHPAYWITCQSQLQLWYCTKPTSRVHRHQRNSEHIIERSTWNTCSYLPLLHWSLDPYTPAQLWLAHLDEISQVSTSAELLCRLIHHHSSLAEKYLFNSESLLVIIK